MVIKDLFCYITIHFTLLITNWIGNTETGLDPNNGVIRRLWCSKLRNRFALVVICRYSKSFK